VSFRGSAQDRAAFLSGVLFVGDFVATQFKGCAIRDDVCDLVDDGAMALPQPADEGKHC